jgi:hypothetical protein
LKKIYFTVTNDLVYDQRMNRICGSLAKNDFDVVLVGRRIKTFAPAKKRELSTKADQVLVQQRQAVLF